MTQRFRIDKVNRQWQRVEMQAQTGRQASEPAQSKPIGNSQQTSQEQAETEIQSENTSVSFQK